MESSGGCGCEAYKCGNPDTCEYQCDHWGNDGENDDCKQCPNDDGELECFRCDGDNNGYPDQCDYQCDTDEDQVWDDCYVCDDSVPPDGIPDSCLKCDTDGVLGPDSCEYQCDHDGSCDQIFDDCFQCGPDGDEPEDDEEPNQCYKCDTNEDDCEDDCYVCNHDNSDWALPGGSPKDDCYTCDNDGNTKVDDCYQCYRDGSPTNVWGMGEAKSTCLMCDKDGDGTKDECAQCMDSYPIPYPPKKDYYCYKCWKPDSSNFPNGPLDACHQCYRLVWNVREYSCYKYDSDGNGIADQCPIGWKKRGT